MQSCDEISSENVVQDLELANIPRLHEEVKKNGKNVQDNNFFKRFLKIVKIS